MDKEDKKPKTFVSTFTLALKPKNRSLSVEKRENTHAATNTLVINNRLGVSSAAGARPIPPPSQKTHHFPKPISDCKISEGINASFQAVIAGSRPRDISWLHNGEKASSFRDAAASLSRTQCSPGDAGNESSSAQFHVTTAKATVTKEIHRAGRDQLHAEVTLKATSSERERADVDRAPPPSPVPTDSRRDDPQTEVCTDKGPPVEFVDPPDQVEVRVGEQARLRCEFRSSCVPVACCWIYNRDKVVVGGPRMSVHSGETQSSVEISQAFAEDTGSYTVIARNRQGSAQHTVSLSVIDRPDPPASQPVVSQLSSQSLVLSWTGPSYDGGTAVFGYIVEVRQEGPDGSGNWTQITNLCKSTSYHVRSGLEPQGRYRFRVRAYNSAGASEPSQESDCVKMEMTKEEKKDDLETSITVSIDTNHKVKDHYNVHEQLGVGKFGKVFRLSHKETNQVCAGKFYRAKTSKEKSAARKEIELMTFLHHPKLVQCLAAYDTRWELVMVMEYIAGGELFERIAHDDFEHTEPTSARYMQQILEGMRYVHKQNIVHLDLKPENIVCVDTIGTQIKIIDFGLASKLEKDKPLLVMHGTPEFVAPEVINYEPVGLETDMWSIGVICFILLSGESPFQGNSNAETFALVTAARYEFDQESFEDISDEAKDFITSLLKRDQRCRLSCTEALAHPWMVSFTPLNRRPTKSLRKEKMRRFLAKRKWKKTGKAVLALQRMANLSSRPDSPGSSSEEPGWSQEAEEAIQSLDKQLRSEPRFQQTLRDAVLPKGASARLTCRVNGYPPPEVRWLHNEKPVSESSTVNTELHDDGLCSLVLTDLEPCDSGVYVCRASNELGEAMCSAKLKVEL